MFLTCLFFFFFFFVFSLCCVVSSCVVLSCLLLLCVVSSRLVEPRLVLSGLLLSRAVLCCGVLFCLVCVILCVVLWILVLPYLVLSCPVLSCLVLALVLICRGSCLALPCLVAFVLLLLKFVGLVYQFVLGLPFPVSLSQSPPSPRTSVPFHSVSSLSFYLFPSLWLSSHPSFSFSFLLGAVRARKLAMVTEKANCKISLRTVGNLIRITVRSMHCCFAPRFYVLTVQATKFVTMTMTIFTQIRIASRAMIEPLFKAT